MIIQHNIMALNAHRQLGGNNNIVSKNLEKLSSGYKINRAGDDAAGLGISEKMRAQITGLTRATSNAQDGISLVQTAEGALTEVHSMLNRMVDLATQSSNGTMQSDDRRKIQDEMNALGEEIDRISKSTNYNGINLLDGSLGTSISQGVRDAGITGVSSDVQVEGGGFAFGVTTTADSIKLTDLSENFMQFFLDNTQMAAGAGANNTGAADKLGGNAADKLFDIKMVLNGTEYSVPLTDFTVGAGAYTGEIELKMANLPVQANGNEVKIKFELNAAAAGNIEANANRTEQQKASYDDLKTMMDGKGITFNFDSLKAATVTAASGAVKGGESLNLQIGDTADVFNKVSVSVDDMSTKGLNIDKLSVSTEADADKAIAKIKSAVNKVSVNRSAMGALQNRLEHTINNLGVATENMTAAESRIRDVDMAKEMMHFTKNNVLSQAAQAMLAQANQQPQQVLQLLR